MQKRYVSWQNCRVSGRVLENAGELPGFLPDLLNLPDAGHARLCKAGNSVKAAADGTFFVKRYRHRGFLKSLRHIFCPARPLLGIAGALHAEKVSIATPEVLAGLRQKRFGILPEYDWLITRDLGDTAVFADKMPLTEELANALIQLLYTMHSSGMEHGDVNLRNLYFDRQSERWGIIDLDNCKLFSHPLSRKRCGRELARLASSFMKLAEANGTSLPCSEIPAYFAKQYASACGWDPDTPAYRKRVEYLAKRKRKR